MWNVSNHMDWLLLVEILAVSIVLTHLEFLEEILVSVTIALKNAGTKNVFAAPGKRGVGELRALCIKSFDVGDGNMLKLKLISVNGVECDNEDEISVKRGDIFLFEMDI